MTPLQLLLIDLVLILFFSVVRSAEHKLEKEGKGQESIITTILGSVSIIAFPVLAIWCILTYITI